MPWELMRSADNVHKPQDNTQKAQNLECPVPVESPNKRISQETRRESEAEEIEEAKKVESSNAFDGQPSVENWKNSAYSRSRNGYTVDTLETNAHNTTTVRTQCKAHSAQVTPVCTVCNGARSRNALARVMTLNSKCIKETKKNAQRVSKYSFGHKSMMYRHPHRFILRVNQP